MFSLAQLPKMIEIYKGNLWHARNTLFRTGSPEGNLNIYPARRFITPNSLAFEVSQPTGIKGKLATRAHQRVFKIMPYTPVQQGAIRMGLLEPEDVECITTLFPSPELWVINAVRLLVQKRRIDLNLLYAKKEKELEYALSREKRERDNVSSETNFLRGRE